MDLRIDPQMLSGAVTPPPCKSMTHRLLIAAALGGGVSTLNKLSFSQDTAATLRCIRALGGQWERVGESGLRIRGVCGRAAASPHFDCGESGSTLRFFLPIALALTGGGVFTGRGRLMQRPLKPYFDLFDETGVSYRLHGDSLTVAGRLSPGDYALPGDVSSQFFTGLLFALPLLDGDSVLRSTTAPESGAYITMTLDTLRAAGICVNARSGCFAVSHGVYAPLARTVEADWSQAGFWYAAKHLGCDLTVEGLDPASSQGDRIIAARSEQLAQSGDREIDVSGCPDLLPPLAVMAAVRSGTTRFTNAARLRLKESDRLRTVCALLTALGGQAAEGADSLTVFGQPRLAGGTVDGAGDHRIVMAAAVAACACAAPVTIKGADAVRKSYPDFFSEYTRLGGNVHVL